MKLLKNLGAFLIGTFIAIVILETTCRVFDLDTESAWKTRKVVGFVNMRPDVHRATQDFNLLYELVPGGKGVLPHVHPKEKKYRQFAININSLGFRGAEFSPKKPKGKYRIFFVGSSNTFGMVNDEDTYPAQLAKLLEDNYPGRFEVINAGISGTVISQLSLISQKIIDNFEPDLIVIQCSNKGRRSFYLREDDYVSKFKSNPDLYNENLQNLFFPSDEAEKIHNYAINTSAVYRTLVGYINFRYYRGKCPGSSNEEISACLTKDLQVYNQFLRYGEEVSRSYFRKLINDNKGVSFIRLDTDKVIHCKKDAVDAEFPHLFHMELCEGRPKGKDWEDVHPPSHVYTWYAAELALKLKNYLALK